MSMRCCSVLLALWIVPAVSFAQQSAPPTAQRIAATEKKVIEEAHSAALVGLQTLEHFADHEHFARYGFRSSEEAQSATLGDPIPVFTIYKAELENYRGDDIAALIHDCNHVVYPVLVSGQPRSSVTVTHLNGQWKATEWGDGVVAKQMIAARQGDQPQSVTFVASVPSQSQKYLKGAFSPGGVQLRALPTAGRGRGGVTFLEESLTGKALIEELAQVARQQSNKVPH